MSDAPSHRPGPDFTLCQDTAAVQEEHITANVRPLATARPLAPSRDPTSLHVLQEMYGQPIPPRLPGSRCRSLPGYCTSPRWHPMTFPGGNGSRYQNLSGYDTPQRWPPMTFPGDTGSRYRDLPGYHTPPSWPPMTFPGDSGSHYRDLPGYHTPPRWPPMTFSGDTVAPYGPQQPSRHPAQPEPNAQSSASTTLHPHLYPAPLMRNSQEDSRWNLRASHSRNSNRHNNHASRMLPQIGSQPNRSSRDNSQQVGAPLAQPVGSTSSAQLDTQLKDLDRRLTDLHGRVDEMRTIQLERQMKELAGLSKDLKGIHEQQLKKQEQRFQRLLQETRVELLKDLRPSVLPSISEVRPRAQIDDGERASTPIGPLRQPVILEDRVPSRPLSAKATAASVPITGAKRAITPPINPRLPVKRCPVEKGVIANRQVGENIGTLGFHQGLGAPPQRSQGDVLRRPGELERIKLESGNCDTGDSQALRQLPQFPQNSLQHSEQCSAELACRCRPDVLGNT
jgi:hypothetical protein